MWQEKTLENCNNDSGKLWKNILGLLNWSSSGAPTKLYSNGNLETSPKRLANILNNFYIIKIRIIRKKLPPINEDPLKKTRWVALMFQLEQQQHGKFVVVGWWWWVADTNYLYPARWGWINEINDGK